MVHIANKTSGYRNQIYPHTAPTFCVVTDCKESLFAKVRTDSVRLLDANIQDKKNLFCLLKQKAHC